MAAGCRPFRTRATYSPRTNSITGPNNTRRQRCRPSTTACCPWSKPSGPTSCSTNEIGDHARILPTPGHTPGHVAFTFGRGRDDAVVSGDLMHSPLQARYPELSMKFDVDQAQAAVTRRNFLERYCDTDTLCCTAHFPSPSTGKIRRWGDGFSCEAVAAG